MFKSLLLLTLTTATLAAGTAAADVYKYKDEKGNIQYTDKPPQLPAERLNVKSQRTDVVAVQERAQADKPCAQRHWHSTSIEAFADARAASSSSEER